MENLYTSLNTSFRNEHLLPSVPLKNGNENSGSTTKSLKGIKVLLAEDNEINILLAKKFLSRWDVEVDCAENGLEAIERVKNREYDLILMDLQMPELDGYEATKVIRSIEGKRFKTVPIIALTASSFLEIEDRAFNSGMTDYVTKPFNPSDLYSVITKYTG